MKRYWIGLVLLLFAFCGCDNGNDKKEKTGIVYNVVEKIVKPEVKNYQKDTKKLQELVTSFVENPTAENLQATRNQWFVVAKDWARCYAFNIGEVRKKKFFRYFATFPINTAGLENRIQNTDLERITPKFVLDILGLDNKGLYGIEYLLYKADLQATVEEFKTSEKRRKILQLVVNELLNDVNDFHSAWEEFAPKLLAEKEAVDSKDNSTNLIFAGLENVINYAWETKLGKAIRKNDIEARYSKKSFDLVKENVAITKKVYFEGGFAQKMKETLKSDKWNKKTTERYQKIEELLASFQTPLVEVVANAEKANLTQLIKELEGLNKEEFSKVKIVFHLVGGAKEGDGD